MFIGCIAVLIAASQFATEVPAIIRAKLTSTNEVRGAFVQTKKDGGKEYVLKGTYHIRPGIDFTWKTVDPFETVFYATPTNYVYSNEDERIERPLSSLPGFSRLADIDKGDFSMFFKAFDALYKEENGKFFVKAKPKTSELSRVLVRVDAEGTVSGWKLTAEFTTGASISISLKDE